MRYHYYTDGKRKVICTTTFAKRPVKGVAVCADADTFDLEKGKALAKARCDYNFAIKRRNYAKRKYEYAKAYSDEVNNYMNDAFTYLIDCDADVNTYAHIRDEVFDKLMEG